MHVHSPASQSEDDFLLRPVDFAAVQELSVHHERCVSASHLERYVMAGDFKAGRRADHRVLGKLFRWDDDSPFLRAFHELMQCSAVLRVG